MLVGLSGYVPGAFARSPIAQQFVAANPVITGGAARAVSAISPSAGTSGAVTPSERQQVAFVARKDLPAFVEGMPLWKKLAIGLAIATPLGYLGYRYLRKRKGSVSA